MKTWIILLVIIGLVVLSGVGFSSLSSGVPVEAVHPERTTIREYVDEEAKTRLAQTYLVTMPFSGRIEAIDLVEGTPVKKGQVVARVVPLDLELSIAAATAAVDRLKASIRENDDASVESTGLKQARSFVDSMNRTVEAAAARVKAGEAKLNYAQRNLARIRTLAESRTATENELDQARLAQVESGVEYQQDMLVLRAIEAMRAATLLMPTSVQQYIDRKGLTHDVLEKQLAEAVVRLREVQRDKERGTMASPIDGVVLARMLSNEQQAVAGDVLLRIGRWDDLEIEADVLSQEVVRVKPLNVVEISGPAIGEQSVKGTVHRVYPAGFTKVSSLGVEQQRVRVIMKFDPNDLKRLRKTRDLGVDYRVRVRIHTAERSGALVIPRSALFRGPDGGWRVFAVRSGRAALNPVKVGLGNDEQAEITSGLVPEDQVILAPETNLADGQSVKVVTTR